MREPLAFRLKPEHLEDIIGQKHLVGKDGIIRKCIENNSLFSMIFFGPPGVGKTSLAKVIANEMHLPYREFNATVGNKKDLDAIFLEAKLSGSLVLICDEVHNMGAPKSQCLMELNPAYRIGLSATPRRNFDEIGSEKILDFYHQNTFEFSIKDAQREHYLVEYQYRILPCAMPEDDWELYKTFSREIVQLQHTLEQEDNEKEQLRLRQRIEGRYRDRAKLLKKNDQKAQTLQTIFDEIPPTARVLIYGDDLHHLAEIGQALDHMGKYYFKYTGELDAQKERPTILKEFRQGIRKILLAVGCLDEGIDIPACDVAVFISSSTSERQFIQRRGRVLRVAPGKTSAWIYDYLVYPILSARTNDDERRLALSMIDAQYRRINLMVEDAINGIQERQKLDQFLSQRRLNPYDF